MAKTSIPTYLVKLTDEFTTLQDVINKVLTRQTKDHLKISKISKSELDRLPESEKVFISKWQYEGPSVEEIKLTSFRNPKDIDVINFLVVSAKLQYSRQRKTENGVLLPKKDRTNDDYIDTIFFEFENRVYNIVLCGYEPNVKRVRNLISESNISDDNKRFELSPDIFTWLFYKFSTFSGSLSDNLLIENIGGFMGNITDEHNVFKGESAHTSDLIITKAFISNGEKIKDMILRLKDDHADITFKIHETVKSNINLSQSEIVGFMTGKDKTYFLPLYMYLYLIPKILVLYELDSAEFLENTMNDFSAKIGEEVILSIAKQNNLNLEDIIERNRPLLERKVALEELNTIKQ